MKFLTQMDNGAMNVQIKLVDGQIVYEGRLGSAKWGFVQGSALENIEYCQDKEEVILTVRPTDEHFYKAM